MGGQLAPPMPKTRSAGSTQEASAEGWPDASQPEQQSLQGGVAPTIPKRGPPAVPPAPTASPMAVAPAMPKRPPAPEAEDLAAPTPKKSLPAPLPKTTAAPTAKQGPNKRAGWTDAMRKAADAVAARVGNNGGV